MEYHPTLAGSGPKYLALADAIVRDIRNGRLQAGSPLPATRQLAERLGVHRNTVVRTYDELTSQGWLEARVGRGTRVVDPLPDAIPPPSHTSELAGFPLPALSFTPLTDRTPCRLSFQAGQPDTRLLPLDVLARAYRRALRGRGRHLVDYGDPRGLERLRCALSSWLSETRSLHVPADRILVTRGSQQALFLAAQALFEPGAKIAVEDHGYRPAWEALRAAGAELIPIGVDEHGLDVDALAACPVIDGLYVTPHHQYPTGAMMSAARRRQLLALATRRRFAILEDDYDHEFHWRGAPVAPLAAHDPHGVVLYISTLSKAFAPGLRVAWVTGPKRAIDRMTHYRRIVDRQGDHVVERAIAELLEDGELPRHIRRVRRVYRSRRDALLTGLGELDGITPVVPPGGLGVWCTANVDANALQRSCERDGLGFAVASEFRFDGANASAFRLGFPAVDAEQIAEGLAILRTHLEAARAA